MAIYTDVNRVTGLFKDVYGELLNLIPQFALVYESISWDDGHRQGNAFVEAVRTRRSGGVTYLPAAAGIQTLRDPIGTKILQSRMHGSQIYIRDGIDEETMRSSVGDRQAFKAGTKAVVESLWESGYHRLEVENLYGQDPEGIGIVESVAGNVVTITEASWAEGIWFGCIDHEVNVYSAPLSADLEVATTITAIDPDAREITLAAVTSVSAGDIITFRGQWDHTLGTPAFVSAAGLIRILSNDGELFGIDAADEELWRGNVVSAGSGPLELSHVLEGAAKMFVRGAMGPVRVLVSPFTFAKLTEDEAALRRYVEKGDVSELVTGAQKLSFYAPVGKLEMVPHPLIKRSKAIGYIPKLFKREGVTDITFSNPESLAGGRVRERYFIPIAGTNGWELRIWSHQGLYTGYPGRGFVIEDIVNG